MGFRCGSGNGLSPKTAMLISVISALGNSGRAEVKSMARFARWWWFAKEAWVNSFPLFKLSAAFESPELL